jgi:hypothetical protein
LGSSKEKQGFVPNDAFKKVEKLNAAAIKQLEKTKKN